MNITYEVVKVDKDYDGPWPMAFWPESLGTRTTQWAMWLNANQRSKTELRWTTSKDEFRRCSNHTGWGVVAVELPREWGEVCP